MKNAVAGGATVAVLPARAASEQDIDASAATTSGTVPKHRVEKILSRCGSEFGNVRRVR